MVVTWLQWEVIAALKALMASVPLGSSSTVAGISGGVDGTGLKVPLDSSVASHFFCKADLLLL